MLKQKIPAFRQGKQSTRLSAVHLCGGEPRSPLFFVRPYSAKATSKTALLSSSASAWCGSDLSESPEGNVPQCMLRHNFFSAICPEPSGFSRDDGYKKVPSSQRGTAGV